jgi:hypothetical protein
MLDPFEADWASVSRPCGRMKGCLKAIVKFMVPGAGMHDTATS